MNDNFKWIIEDIKNSLLLRVIFDKGEEYFKCIDFVNADFSNISIIEANINSLENMLYTSLVRFINVNNSSYILDIPLRNIKKLYDFSNKISDSEKVIDSSIIEGFFVNLENDLIIKNYEIIPYILNECTTYLDTIINEACLFGSYSSNERFESLKRISIVNYERKNDNKFINIKDR